MAAYQGMHVLPGKHSDEAIEKVQLLNRRTDRQTDAGKSYPYVLHASKVTQQSVLANQS